MPCILFFDELDGLLPCRNGSKNSTKDEPIGVGSGNTSSSGGDSGGGSIKWVLVLAATTRPDAIDTAALRRLPCKVEVPLPDAPARADILHVLLRGERFCESLPAAVEGLAAQDCGLQLQRPQGAGHAGAVGARAGGH